MSPSDGFCIIGGSVDIIDTTLHKTFHKPTSKRNFHLIFIFLSSPLFQCFPNLFLLTWQEFSIGNHPPIPIRYSQFHLNKIKTKNSIKNVRFSETKNKILKTERKSKNKNQTIKSTL